MRRILIMMDSLTCGGAEKSLISLLPFLVRPDYQITLMLVRRGGLFETYVPPEVDIVKFPFTHSVFRKIIYSLALRMPWNKKRHKAEVFWQCIGRYYPSLKQQYDVAIAYQQGFPTFYIADKIIAKKKFCWINTDLIAAGYSPAFCNYFYNMFDKISVVSDILREKIINYNYYNDKTKTLTCLDIMNETLIRQMAVQRRPYISHNNCLDIVTVGRLVPLKGYDIAIEAAKILKVKGVNFIWHIVGGGELYNQLAADIIAADLSSMVVLEGELLNPYPYIASCDIYVQTSKFEGFGLTVGEAKILGKPIVSTNFPVIYNQITNDYNGLVVEMNGEAIADGILRLIKDSALKERLVGNLLKEHNTTAETESAKVIKLIEE